MKLRVSAILFLWCGAHLFAADPKWIRMKSEHFEMYSTAGEHSTREMVKNFEQVRSFFQQILGGKDDRAHPVRLLLFDSRKEFAPYRPKEFNISFNLKGPDRDIVVMTNILPEAHVMAVHEYTHLVIERQGLKLPPWLDEGFAQFFSTLRPEGDKTLVGEVFVTRDDRILRPAWVPLSTIVAADDGSPFYNRKDKVGSLYQEGWALTHMLMLGRRYEGKLDDLIRAIQKGTSSEDALTAVYGKPISEIDKDLQAYIHGGEFRARLVPTKIEKVTEQLTAVSMPDFDVNLILADLLTRLGQEETARQRLQELSAEDSTRPEPYLQLGYLSLKQGKKAEAETFFARAYELGDRGPGMLWDYGRMAGTNHPKEAIQVLSELLEKEPSRVEVRLQLASIEVRNHQPDRALATLADTKGLTKADAPKVFLLAAHAYIDLNDPEHAKANLDQALKWVTEDSDKQEADNLQNQLNRMAR